MNVSSSVKKTKVPVERHSVLSSAEEVSGLKGRQRLFEQVEERQMIVSDLVDSEDLRNRLMDVIKCANDEYPRIFKEAPTHGVTKDALRHSEYFIRIRLYSVFLDTFGVENEWGLKDQFTDYVSSFTEQLASLIGALEINAEAKKTVAACLAICVAAAVEDARDMKLR